MTAQASDIVLFRKQQYSLAGVDGTGLFDPAALGLKPVGWSTACWRGYVCTYSVKEDRLLLTTLQISFAKTEPPPTLFGQNPDSKARLHGFCYSSLAHPIPFTGGLLLGRDFVRELYVHMGFHPAWKFREVHELIFENGLLREAGDRSQAAEEFRKRIKSEDLRPSDTGKIGDWIEQTFSLNYQRPGRLSRPPPRP
jgi:hypothetical protein